MQKAKYWLIERYNIIIGFSGLIISIIGVIISSYFAFKTYENTDQIKRLDNLITFSSKTTNKLVDVVQILKDQNEKLISVNGKLNEQANAILFQNSLISKQLKIGINQQKLSNYHDSLNKKSKIISLYYSTLQLFDLVPHPLIEGNYWDSLRVHQMIMSLSNIVNTQTNNDYLLENDTLSSKWYAVYSDLNTVKFLFTTPYERFIAGKTDPTNPKEPIFVPYTREEFYHLRNERLQYTLTKIFQVFDETLNIIKKEAIYKRLYKKIKRK